MKTLTSPDTYSDSCASHFRTPLPPELRAEATGMSWSTFTETYAPAAGPIRLGAWTASPGRHDLLECQATIATGDSIASLTATASGAIAALSDMLYRLGSGVEIIRLHQYPHSGGVATFLLCERDERRSWSMGSGPCGEESALGALIAAANRLS
jgi:hypothetical protein